MSDTDPLKTEISDERIEAKERQNNDPLRCSAADRSRPDYLKLLIQESSRRMMSVNLDEDGEDEEENAEEAKIVHHESGEYIRGDSEHYRVFRKFKDSVRIGSMNGLDNTKVEVRLHDVSYHVPVAIDDPAMSTVRNQSIFYRVYKLFSRLWDCCSTFERLDYRHIFFPYEKKAILRNANLIFKPGLSYLVMGPPACGKTTLLQVIAGLAHDERRLLDGRELLNKAHVSGRVEYNGLTREEAPEMVVQNVVSYVEQLDDHEPFLTVRETFDFANRCRTGGKHTESGGVNTEQENLTIEGLGLEHVADTFVGNTDVRGVSGGQRRRVTIGEMMQGQNPVACADEISTGLDSASTYDMIRSIVSFAKLTGTTRIVSLLQPGPETFSLFDEVVILSEGFVIFAGLTDRVIEYFGDLGYDKPVMMDVADFLQAVSTPDGANMMNPLIRTNGHLTSSAFADRWKSSNLGSRIVNDLESDGPTRWSVGKLTQDVENTTANIIPLPDQMKMKYQNSVRTSLVLVFRRSLTIWTRNTRFIIGKTLENAAMAITLGMVLFGSGKINYSCNPDDPTMIMDSEGIDRLFDGIFGCIFMTCFRVALATSVHISGLVASRGIHYKQSNANFYQSISFIFGRLFATFPQRGIEVLAFCGAVYFLIPLDITFVSFALYMLMMLTYTICLDMIFNIVVMSFRTAQHVQSVSIVVLLVMTMFSGFIVYPSEIPHYAKWIYWINPIAWAYNGFLSIEFTSGKYDATKTCMDVTSFLENRGFRISRYWILWSFISIIVFTIVATTGLVLVLRYSRFQVYKKKKKSLEDDGMEEHNQENNISFTQINLTFENICYDVKASTGDETLRLLDNVSGAMMAGRMCALMGSSGAGKTTLMDVISLRKTSGKITGRVELNGFPQEKVSFLRSSGYVEQFDVQTSQLTVLETVIFSARLRLDSRNEATKDDVSKILFVDNVLEMLELTSLKHQQVGDLVLGTGLSFEQRKRLAIAVELAGSPSVLFLDEPTSGLDSRGAVLVMRAMKRIANTGRTVCATIHQPSSAVFQMFDDLLLLKKGGRLVFFGDLGENSINLTNYFEAGGSEAIKYGQNPASWMLLASENKISEEWAESYASSNQYRALMDQIHAEREFPDPSKKISFDTVLATTPVQRLMLMLSRVQKIYRRSPTYNLTRMFHAVVMGGLLAYMFSRRHGADTRWKANQVEGLLGTIFFALLILGLTSIMGVIPEVHKIRDVFYKHRASGIMNDHAVQFAIVVGEIPYIMLFTVLFSLIFFLGVQPFWNITKFIKFWSFILLSTANYTYFGHLFVVLVKSVPGSKALAGVLVGINLFGSGYIVKPRFGTAISRITSFFAPGYYAYEGIIMSQFEGLTNEVIAENGSDYFYFRNCTYDQKDECIGDMESYAKFVFGDKFSPDNIKLDVLVLLGYLLISTIGTHFALKKLNYVNT